MLCVAALAWAAPMSQASAKCTTGCQAKRDHAAQLRRQNAQQKRPNVVVIDTDDMNVTDLFVMRNTLSMLGAHGTTFSNSYVSYPLCCPSRASFLTGQYAHNHGVTTDQQYGQLDNTNTLAVWLRRAKYRTAMVGKYLNGYGVVNPREIPPGWTQWYGLTDGTEQHRYGFKLNENGKVRHYARKPSNYIDYVLNSKVDGVLKKWAPSPKPFFLYYNPNNPHGESGTPSWSTRDPEPAPQYLGTFGDITAPHPPNFDEANVSDKPEQIQQIPRLSSEQLADIDRRYRGRLESLLSVDDEVKRIVRLVRKYGDKRKTFFMFTSDNGLEMGAHRIEFKDYLYEEGERVPLIIRGPNFPQGTTRNQLVANIDLAPTITALTGARPGRTMDGIPLLPLATDPSAQTNRSLLFESFDIGTFGVRQGPWVYNLWNNGSEELYNLESDPYELTNLLYGPGAVNYTAIRAQLAARLAQLRTCSGASCH
ncbi:MAG: N-acetylglucosamine-6-sulfatase [Solirubrobacterales bacterium]|nr:N-acetylglucosamine-6-sulfatase [Solirubrobacterales bacterium]